MSKTTGEDPYGVLGVSPDASDDEVKAAWRRLIQVIHPDVVQHSGSVDEKSAQTVNAAYTTIRKSRNNQSGLPSASRPTASTPGGPPPNASTAVRRAHVAVQYAEALADNWIRHLRAMKTASKNGRDAFELLCGIRGRAEELIREGESLEANVRLTAEQVIDQRVLVPIQVSVTEFEAAWTRWTAGKQHDNERRAVLQRARHCLEQLTPDHVLIGAALDAARNQAERLVKAATSRYKAVVRDHGDTPSASRRCIDTHARIRNASREFFLLYEKASAATVEAMVSAASAGGLAEVELKAAHGHQARFVGERLSAEARLVIDRIQALDSQHVDEGAYRTEIERLVTCAKEWKEEGKSITPFLDDALHKAQVQLASAEAQVTKMGPDLLIHLQEHLEHLDGRLRVAIAALESA